MAGNLLDTSSLELFVLLILSAGLALSMIFRRSNHIDPFLAFLFATMRPEHPRIGSAGLHLLDEMDWPFFDLDSRDAWEPENQLVYLETDYLGMFDRLERIGNSLRSAGFGVLQKRIYRWPFAGQKTVYQIKYIPSAKDQAESISNVLEQVWGIRTEMKLATRRKYNRFGIEIYLYTQA